MASISRCDTFKWKLKKPHLIGLFYHHIQLVHLYTLHHVGKKKNLMGNQFNIKTFKYNTNMYKSSRSATDLQLIQPLHLLLSNRVEYTIRSVLNISNSVTL